MVYGVVWSEARVKVQAASFNWDPAGHLQPQRACLGCESEGARQLERQSMCDEASCSLPGEDDEEDSEDVGALHRGPHSVVERDRTLQALCLLMQGTLRRILLRAWYA